MRQYELMVIFDPETDERAVQPLFDKFLTVVTKDGGLSLIHISEPTRPAA